MLNDTSHVTLHEIQESTRDVPWLSITPRTTGYVPSDPIADTLATGEKITQTTSGSALSPNETTVPVMTFEELHQTLFSYEKKYGMKSKDFYNLWLSGKAPEGIDTIMWITLYEAWHNNYLSDK